MKLPRRAKGGTRFTCPHCGVFAQQDWPAIGSGHPAHQTLGIALCAACQKYSLWFGDEMVWPDNADVDLPNQDLDDDIKTDYLEASSILNKSPRGAAALLRLSIQKLCKALELPGENLNADIAKLVERGLTPTIQQALDSVRVIGNEAVHPGTMNIKDDVETARALFDLVNVIADTLITTPKRVESIYQSIPQSKRDAVKQRDSNP